MMIELKKFFKSNGKKKEYFVKWYIDSDKSKESYDKNCKKNSEVEYDTAMNNWLLEEETQEAIKEYLKAKRKLKMLEMYDAMYNKAIAGDVKSAEWVEKFFKSDFFEDGVDEVNDYLEGINIPALKGE
ncbi:hypothetical protein HBE96_23470 [Clostridium sp. P21]|uniref:Uncharacterized protein n=1 Tax=Clostridium muellerianum TaxID=2716538 RepID=A0A7Y0ELD5_9CLOT|nr:hypothetical protein [Clostridium muellerianum]NMM65541.1 hypothetical protein [Clostridium muellerianum]